ncbi:MAG TPA: IS200/IS605 family transposase [Bacteroidota bacterium]|nr:IS200/IS605 family transposase [Bacteroidota bacterium]
MVHSFTKIFIHLVWSTKFRQPFLIGELRPTLKAHIEIYAKENNIQIESLAVQPDHVHLLIQLQSDQRVEDIPKLLKGESSHWLNAQDVLRVKFSWQRGYSAFSVSIGHISRVRNYILNQDEHHRMKPFSEELQYILEKYGFTVHDSED